MTKWSLQTSVHIDFLFQVLHGRAVIQKIKHTCLLKTLINHLALHIKYEVHVFFFQYLILFHVDELYQESKYELFSIEEKCVEDVGQGCRVGILKVGDEKWEQEASEYGEQAGVTLVNFYVLIYLRIAWFKRYL